MVRFCLSLLCGCRIAVILMEYIAGGVSVRLCRDGRGYITCVAGLLPCCQSPGLLPALRRMSLTSAFSPLSTGSHLSYFVFL